MGTIKQVIFKEAVNQVIANRTLRSVAVRQLDKYLYNSIMNLGKEQLHQEKLDQFAFASGILHQAKKNLDRRVINPNVVKKMTQVFVGDSYSPDRYATLNTAKETFKEKHGEYPPTFLVLSPGKGCNLHCVGCYASADSAIAEKLDFETARRIVKENHDLFGSRFMTISGGEPFMYKDSGKTLLDIFEEFNDTFFLVYTNGTLINETIAGKLAKLGNVTPAISVEGWEEQTDNRRGKGIYSHILKAMANLRKVGVPFGISVTATSQNFDILMQDDFYDYFFNEEGATYMWQFQLMPIGKGKDVVDLMIKPDQRVKLYEKWSTLLNEKHYPIADFWNSGSLSSGCIAYGRFGGYFYIDWNGNVMPCVFVPYYKDNIKDIYASGKDLGDAIQSKMFRNGRAWQNKYRFDDPEHRGNGLMSCSIRDHYDNFKHHILTPDAKGEDAEAEAVLSDPMYEAMMKAFDAELSRLTDKLFEEKYLKSEKNLVSHEVDK